MSHNTIYIVCGKPYSFTALVDLVFTFAPLRDELVEIAWHRECYLSAHRLTPVAAEAASETSGDGDGETRPAEHDG